MIRVDQVSRAVAARLAMILAVVEDARVMEDEIMGQTAPPEVMDQTASRDAREGPPTAKPLERERIEQPGKLMRLAVMIRELLEEVRRAPLDAHAREHLAEVHGKVVEELKASLTPPLAEELERLTSPMTDDETPSESQLRIAQAQLLGWLEGLFQGIQAAIATQQAAMVQQLEEMRRRSLPPGERPDGPGQYL